MKGMKDQPNEQQYTIRLASGKNEIKLNAKRLR